MTLDCLKGCSQIMDPVLDDMNLVYLSGIWCICQEI